MPNRRAVMAGLFFAAATAEAQESISPTEPWPQAGCPPRCPTSPPYATPVHLDGYRYMLSDPNLTIWVRLIAVGGLEQAVAAAAVPYTMFPASNEAFAPFPNIVKQLLGYQSGGGSGVGKSTMDAFPDTSKIVAVVRSHTVSGMHLPDEFMGKKITVTSITGTPINIDATNPSAVVVTWNSAANGEPLATTVTEPPIILSNAVLYVVNKIEPLA